MPTYPITSNAVQVSQAITADASIQNTGTVDVYVSNEAGVSSVNYSMLLTPGSILNWPTGSELWAVTASTQGQLGILYNANNVSLGSLVANISGPVTATITGPVDANITNASLPVTGSVNANITNANIPVTGNVNATITNASLTVSGAVNANITGGSVSISSGSVNVGTIAGNVTVGGILTPVLVQGGGEVLASGTVNVPDSGALVTINIPGPVSGLKYSSVTVEVDASGASLPALGIDTCLIGAYQTTPAGFKLVCKTAIALGTPTGIAPFQTLMGNPRRTRFTFPLTGNYPLRLVLGGQTIYSPSVPVNYIVSASTVQLPGPATDIQYGFSNDALSLAASTYNTSVSIGASITSQMLYLPPSFTPYKYRWYTATTGGAALTASLSIQRVDVFPVENADANAEWPDGLQYVNTGNNPIRAAQSRSIGGDGGLERAVISTALVTAVRFSIFP